MFNFGWILLHYCPDPLYDERFAVGLVVWRIDARARLDASRSPTNDPVREWQVGILARALSRAERAGSGTATIDCALVERTLALEAALRGRITPGSTTSEQAFLATLELLNFHQDIKLRSGLHGTMGYDAPKGGCPIIEDTLADLLFGLVRPLGGTAP